MDDLLDFFLFNEIMGDEDVEDDEDEFEYAWRDYVEDGSEYGLYPEDFEYEYDYEEALEAAREAAEQDAVDDGPTITLHITDEMIERMKTEDPETVLREGAYKQLKEMFGGLLGEDAEDEQEPSEE